MITKVKKFYGGGVLFAEAAAGRILAALMQRFISVILRYVPRVFLQRIAKPVLRVVSFFYRGKGVQCPVCGSAFRKFLPYGRMRSRANALCPHCLSLERHRLIWIYLKERTDFFSRPLDVLHIAPEVCFIRPFEKQHGIRYITADLDSPWAKVKMDIQAMPFAENSFDVVLCNHVLEHVDDDHKALREICRVLKPGGLAVLQVPFFNPVPDVTVEDASVKTPGEREKYYGQADHVRRYGKDYVNRIAGSGMHAEELAFAEELGPEICSRHGLIPTEKIYIGRK